MRTMVGANRSRPGQTRVWQALRQVRKTAKHNGAVGGAAVGKKNVFVPVVRIRSPFQQRMAAHHLLVFRPRRRKSSLLALEEGEPVGRRRAAQLSYPLISGMDPAGFR